MPRRNIRQWFSQNWKNTKTEVWGALKDAGSTAGKAAWHEGIKPAFRELWNAGKQEKKILSTDKKILKLAGNSIPAKERRSMAAKIVSLQGKGKNEQSIVLHFAEQYKKRALSTADARLRMNIIRQILYT